MENLIFYGVKYTFVSRVKLRREAVLVVREYFLWLAILSTLTLIILPALSFDAIYISGSHFSETSHFDGRSWPYWYTHAKIVTPPYYMTEFSHYEFYAGGGG
jgi:hypothetical protein